MTTETVQSNEERVRAVWRNVCNEVTHLYEEHWPPTANEWAAAWEYTEAALEEVRKLREDVTRTEDAFADEHHCLRIEMEPWWSEDDPPYKPTEEDFAAWDECVTYWVRRICSTERILARLQALLVAKSAGMKPEAL